ncbi:MAG: hypothetical protein JXB14_02825 [Candidatus Altiarchaeota archaeon]|nr:hypothetical protein [Candidatus Altiarchaeota archaeon]
MAQSWNVRGSSVSTIILWLGSLLGFFIVFGWYSSLIQPTQLSFETVSADVQELQIRINSACGSTSYASWYNPRTEEGNFIINNSRVCIEIPKKKKCLLSICDTNITKTIDLSEIIYINVAKYHQNDTISVWGDRIPVNTTYVSPFQNGTANDTDSG